jgi:hypothetical protein
VHSLYIYNYTCAYTRTRTTLNVSSAFSYPSLSLSLSLSLFRCASFLPPRAATSQPHPPHGNSFSPFLCSSPRPALFSIVGTYTNIQELSRPRLTTTNTDCECRCKHARVSLRPRAHVCVRPSTYSCVIGMWCE